MLRHILIETLKLSNNNILKSYQDFSLENEMKANMNSNLLLIKYKSKKKCFHLFHILLFLYILHILKLNLKHHEIISF